MTTGTPQVIDQIKLQLKKLVPVHKVADFKREDKKVIFKEMALLKVVGKKKKIEKCIKACKSFNPVVLDKTKQSIVIQITALRREIDKMSKKLKPLGLISTSRTGAIAMTRGSKYLNKQARKEMKMFYEKDTDVNLIKDKKIAIFGYEAKAMLMR